MRSGFCMACGASAGGSAFFVFWLETAFLCLREEVTAIREGKKDGETGA